MPAKYCCNNTGYFGGARWRTLKWLFRKWKVLLCNMQQSILPTTYVVRWKVMFSDVCLSTGEGGVHPVPILPSRLCPILALSGGGGVPLLLSSQTRPSWGSGGVGTLTTWLYLVTPARFGPGGRGCYCLLMLSGGCLVIEFCWNAAFINTST